MSSYDSEDDFVQVSGYQSSDSDSWEKISGYSSSEDEIGGLDGMNVNSTVPQEAAPSYNQHDNVDDIPMMTDKREKATRRGHAKKDRRMKDRKRRQWDTVTLRQGLGAPHDPVEFLGLTGAEKALLHSFGISTIEQLVYFNSMALMSTVLPGEFELILDLQERAAKSVCDYAAKASKQPENVWGYIYLGEETLERVMIRSYLDSDSLCFLWSPMPTVMYRDQLAIDELVGAETKNRELRSRYSRFIKINLSKLCDAHYGRLYQRDPFKEDKWINVNLMEAADLAEREDLWHSFEPGNDIFTQVMHGSIVIPAGRIPHDCIEFDERSSSSQTNNRFKRYQQRQQQKWEDSDDEVVDAYNPHYAKLSLYH